MLKNIQKHGTSQSAGKGFAYKFTEISYELDGMDQMKMGFGFV